MENTKLGISVGLMVATLYFLGLLNFLGLIVLAGYVLLFETNDWLRASAVKAMTIVIVFSLVSIITSIGNDVFGILNSLVPELGVKWPADIDYIVKNLASIIKTIMLLILATKSFTQRGINVGFIDKIIMKHMWSNNNGNYNNVNNCPNCGSNLGSNDTFCTACGQKLV